ncbi:urease accessory protein UreF [Rudaeicoccus suwonensis]|uniref:Urease accessory protein n=1 Tax=Rudaeicoccus suwonensis TaxID=657409 RepID=A0A561E7H8_9MICO|nr:urease accessory UreF family protein [Rudaeicoccus suwonensis]TWE11568.1 urease accessory protein [Rudaeicoccus suwonensis]
MATSSAALLLADARLPTGGHTQSAGLEAALAGGLGRDSIPAYIAARLRTCVRTDAATAVVALHVVRSGSPLAPVVDAWAARVPSAQMRGTAQEAGRGYLRLHRHLHLHLHDEPYAGAGLATTGTESVGDTAQLPRPVAVAVLAAELDLTAAELAHVICHDDVQSVCAAALKLTPCDPADTVVWALRAAPQVDAVVEEVTHLTTPDQIPASAAPLMEQWQHAHAMSTRRLFRA